MAFDRRSLDNRQPKKYKRPQGSERIRHDKTGNEDDNNPTRMGATPCSDRIPGSHEHDRHEVGR